MDGRAIDDVVSMADLLRIANRRRPGRRAGSRCEGRAWAATSRSCPRRAARAAAVVAICPASGERPPARPRRRALHVRRRPHRARGVPGRARRPSRADALEIPVLLLHAEGDEQVPVEHSRELAALLRSPRSRLIALPGGHHRSIQHDAELQAVSLRFIEQSLADAADRRRAIARLAGPVQPPEAGHDPAEPLGHAGDGLRDPRARALDHAGSGRADAPTAPAAVFVVCLHDRSDLAARIRDDGSERVRRLPERLRHLLQRGWAERPRRRHRTRWSRTTTRRSRRRRDRHRSARRRADRPPRARRSARVHGRPAPTRGVPARSAAAAPGRRRGAPRRTRAAARADGARRGRRSVTRRRPRRGRAPSLRGASLETPPARWLR